MEKPIRIAVVGPLPPPAGGMANQTRQLVRLLRQEGKEVQVVRVNAPSRPAWIGRIRILRAFFRLIPYVLQLWRVTGRVELVHVMANSWWSWHLYTMPAVWIARRRGAPVVINYRGGEAEAFFEKAFRWVEPTLNRASAVVVPSNFLFDVFKRWGIPSIVVPNIIDLKLFSNAPASSDPGPKRQAPHVIVTRNLEELYDIPTALRAFQAIHDAMPSAHLSIAGSGPQRESLEQLAAQLGVAGAVTFTGRLDNEAMAALYRSADIVLNPSLADNMPISILEALASGVPVVSTNVGGIPYIVEDGKTARLVAARDFEAMAAAALELLTNDEAAVGLKTNGRALVEQYAWENVRKRLFAVYEGLIEDPSKLGSLSSQSGMRGWTKRDANAPKRR